MRLTSDQTQIIRQLAREVAGDQSLVRVFGSRLDDAARGGDVDLLVEIAEPVNNPALIAARLSARARYARAQSGCVAYCSQPHAHAHP